MANGDTGHWQAIDELRKRAERNSERIVALEQQVSSGAANVLASERRIENRMDDLEASINARLDRTRNTALALLAIAVPVISGLIGALIQGGGG